MNKIDEGKKENCIKSKLNIYIGYLPVKRSSMGKYFPRSQKRPEAEGRHGQKLAPCARS